MATSVITPSSAMDRQTWLLLILLSVLWGASFFFAGVALRELPPVTLALGRVFIAVLLLYPFLNITAAVCRPPRTDS